VQVIGLLNYRLAVLTRSLISYQSERVLRYLQPRCHRHNLFLTVSSTMATFFFSHKTFVVIFFGILSHIACGHPHLQPNHRRRRADAGSEASPRLLKKSLSPIAFAESRSFLRSRQLVCWVSGDYVCLGIL
jgi:hypothetical protein